MGVFWKWMRLRKRGLRHELAVSFGLVILALLVFLGYLFPGVSSVFQTKTNLNVVAGIVFLIVLLGFFLLTQKIIDPLIKISKEAKKIAEGDLTREVKLSGEDEIGELGVALNRMTKRIKENMDELKVFSEKTEVINSEINKRIFVLASLLQISNLISQNAKLEEIIEAGVDRCLSSGEMTLGCLILKDRQSNEYLVKSVHSQNKEELMAKGLGNFKVQLGVGVLGQAILRQETIVIDKNFSGTYDAEEFRSVFLLKNALVVPVVSRGKVHGLLIAGNNKENFSCHAADKELLDLLSKQLSIAIENDILATRVEKLEIVDSLTGLYNSTFVGERLNEEIKRAIRFQRPCAFVLFTIDRFNEFNGAFGHIAAENVLIKLGSILKENISEVDKAARFGDHEFALILPEKNKRQAIEVADEIRRKIEFVFSGEEDSRRKLTCTGSVTENPVDGITASELISKARETLDSAKDQGGNRICYKI